MIDRYSPVGRAMSLRQMMDRLLEDAFVMPGEQQDGGASSMAINAYEEGDNFVIEAQLPGMRPEDIDVSVERGTLTIRGQAQNEQERTDRNYAIREHRRSAFSRSLRLPDTVDTDACDAKFEHGVLRLVFPKSERARPRRISIGGSGQQAKPAAVDGHTAGAPQSSERSSERSSMEHDAKHSGSSTMHGAGRTGTENGGSERGRAEAGQGGMGTSGASAPKPNSGSAGATSGERR